MMISRHGLPQDSLPHRERKAERSPKRFGALAQLYGFEWLAAFSVLATAVFFLTSPVSTQYFRLAVMTFFSLGKVALVSIVFIVFFKVVPAHRRGSKLRDTLLATELAHRRFWCDVFRILFSFSLIETSHLTLKLYIPLINPTNNDHLLHQLDRALLFGRDPVQLVIDLFVAPFSVRFMDALYSGFYFFLLWGGVVVFFTVLEARSRIAFFNSFLLMWQLGLLMYVLLPSWGPVFVRPETFSATLQYMPATVHIQSGLFEETRSIVAGNYNIVVHYFGLAAFPSLHVGVFVLYSLWARRVGRAWLVWNLAFVVLILLGSMLTGYHYLVDGIGGALVAAFSFIAARHHLDRSTTDEASEDRTASAIIDP